MTRRLLSCFLLGIAVFAFNQCSRQSSLAEVAPPTGFDDLDVSVQQQFHTRWDALHPPPTSKSEQGDAWGELGLWYHAYQYAVSADRCYQNAMMLAPSNPRWPYYRGIIAREAGNLEQAKAWFQTSATVRDQSIPATLELAQLAYNDQRTAQAAEYYQAVLSAEPNQPGALFGMAEVHLSRGEAEQAIPLLEKVLSQQPQASEVLYSMGRALSMVGERTRAKHYFDAVPKRNNEHQPLDRKIDWLADIHRLRSGGKELTRRGWQAFQKGDLDKAAFYAGKAIREDPSNAELHANYAVVLKAMKRPLDAFESLQTAMELDPKNPRAFLITGTLFLEQRRLEGAEKYLLQAVTLDPASPEGHLQLGRLYHLQGRYEKACDQYASVRQLDTTTPMTRFWHTALLFGLERPEQALPLLKQDLQFLPDDRPLRLLQARAWATVGDGNQMNPDGAKQLLDWDNPTLDVFFAETAAMVAAGSGDFDTAVAWQQAAVNALETSSMRIATMIARRRLALYASGEPSEKPWQVNEPLNTRPVQAPKR